MVPKILRGNFENVFSSVCNMISRHFVHANFVYIINNIEGKTNDCWLVNEESTFA